MANAKKITMDELLAGEKVAPTLVVNENISGKVLSVKKHEILIDLGPIGVGFIPRKEAGYLRDLEIGKEVLASIIDTEMSNGMVLLSLRKAAKDKGWEVVYEYKKDNKIIEVTPIDANRGGLLVEIEGVRGFLPVSQLSSEHYPHSVNSGDKEAIIKKLSELMGKSLKVKVLDVDKRLNKLIFSEREALREEAKSRLAEIKVGDKLSGIVTGIVDFGVFVNIDGLEGLIHISELAWERLDTVGDRLRIGDKVDVKVTSVENDRLSLSIKQLQEDPWANEASRLKIGDEVEGTITKIAPIGAFIQITPAVEGMAQAVDANGKKIDPETVFKLGEKMTFVITALDTSSRKITLALKSDDKKPAPKKK
ncbi:S1 RNA-binding domain-containing protein [Candidatus Saccharibacteria bacterium]|nr:S1 RNA-binding domain-containing protein [Candidatus Saccharibacteria bacterium]